METKKEYTLKEIWKMVYAEKSNEKKQKYPHCEIVKYKDDVQ